MTAGCGGLTERLRMESSLRVMRRDTIGRVFAMVLLAGTVAVAPVDAAEEESPLGRQMDEISKALKSLRKLAKSEERWTASAEQMRNAQAACIKAMALVPDRVEKMPAGTGKAKAVADYKRLLGLSLAALCELEVAFLEEDEKKVDGLLDEVKNVKKEGHEKFEDE